jgi:hypothetical protein
MGAMPFWQLDDDLIFEGTIPIERALERANIEEALVEKGTVLLN